LATSFCCAARATSRNSPPIGASSTKWSGRNARKRAALKPLPARRTTDYEEARVLVASSGGFILRRVFYSVPSRLIGQRLNCPLSMTTGSTAFWAQRGSSPCGAVGRRKAPVALLSLVYRDQLFPRRAYARAFEALTRQ
jgi:hypothetical protein